MTECPVRPEAHVAAGEQQPQNDDGAGNALLCQWAQVLAVRIAPVRVVRGDDGPVFRPLMGSVDELISPRSPSDKGPFGPEAERAAPTVDPLEIGSIARHIADGLHVFGQVIGGILIVAFEGDQQLVPGQEEQTCGENTAEKERAEFDAQHHQGSQHCRCGYGYPRRPGEGQDQSDRQDDEGEGQSELGDGLAVRFQEQGQDRKPEHGQDGTVTRVVLVEGLHDPMARLLVETVARVSDDRVDDDTEERNEVEQYELFLPPA